MSAIPYEDFVKAARMMYEDFRKESGGVHRGQTLPPWEALPKETQRSWIKWVGGR